MKFFFIVDFLIKPLYGELHKDTVRCILYTVRLHEKLRESNKFTLASQTDMVPDRRGEIKQLRGKVGFRRKQGAMLVVRRCGGLERDNWMR